MLNKLGLNMSRFGVKALLQRYHAVSSKWQKHERTTNFGDLLSFDTYTLRIYEDALVLDLLYNSRYISIYMGKFLHIRISCWGKLMEFALPTKMPEFQVPFTCANDAYRYVQACIKVIDSGAYKI